jgi:hypothetical protein
VPKTEIVSSFPARQQNPQRLLTSFGSTKIGSDRWVRQILFSAVGSQKSVFRKKEKAARIRFLAEKSESQKNWFLLRDEFDKCSIETKFE